VKCEGGVAAGPAFVGSFFTYHSSLFTPSLRSFTLRSQWGTLIASLTLLN
jgi:hypothetical protein